MYSRGEQTYRKDQILTPVSLMTPAQRSPLLTLPVHIRKHIWRYTDLVRPCPIGFECESRRVLGLRRWGWTLYKTEQCFRPKEDYRERRLDQPIVVSLVGETGSEETVQLLYEESNGYRRGINDPLEHCNHEPLPIALLSVCKQLCSEATEVLYGGNAFSLNCYDRVARRSFLGLSDQAVASLRRLHIIHLPDRNPIQHLESIFERFQEPWERVCRSLSERILPDRLRLSVECLARDSATQKVVLKPLLSLPRLRDICLNFGDVRDPETEKSRK